MSISTHNVVPFTQAHANLSDLAHDATAASETIFTKNIAHEEMLAALRATLIPDLRRFAHIGRRDHVCPHRALVRRAAVERVRVNLAPSVAQ